MTQEELKAKAKSFGLYTGEFVALRKIYNNRRGPEANEDEFIRAVVELLESNPGEA